MMDLSDGLAKDLSRLCVASGVGARVELGQVPMHRLAGDRLRRCWVWTRSELALSGGEDYELLATIDLTDRRARARGAATSGSASTSPRSARSCRDPGVTAVDGDGRTRDRSQPAGWDHFAMSRCDARPRALSIAGSDSGGGAGIQADLKTFSALGVFGMTAITAVTVQNTRGVCGYEELSPGTVGDQIRAVVTDIGVDAAKTGMLASVAIVEAVADAVAETAVPNLVVDPVFVSKHGHALLAEDAVDALRDADPARSRRSSRRTCPRPPGSSGSRSARASDMARAARAILAMGPRAVLVKGGHLEGVRSAPTTCSSTGSAMEWIARRAVAPPRTPMAPAACCPRRSLRTSRGARSCSAAVRGGKAFVTEAIRHALPLGRGIGPVDPMWRLPAS